jgi:NADH-quinone oxidoreductase subunit G
MEGYQGRPPAALASFFWAPGWNSYQAVSRYQTEINGPLRGGPAGVGLLEPQGGETSYFDSIPEPFETHAGEFLVIRSFRLFGSEELSIHAPGIAERASKPCMEINPADAAELGVSIGEQLKITLGGSTWKIPAEANPSLPRGVAAFFSGPPGMAGHDLPAWGRIEPSNP